MTSCNVSLWKDVGFQEGSVVVPSLSDTLPTADYYYYAESEEGQTVVYNAELQNLHTATSDLFTAFRLKGTFDKYLPCSYLKVVYEFVGGKQTFYGWIDDVSIKSDNSTYPETIITWHVDLWRTYLKDAEYGYGMVTRRARGTADPPQTCSYRYRLPGEYKPFTYTGAGSDLYWVIVTYVAETTDNKVTLVRQMVFPVDPNSPTTNYTVTNGTETAKCPNMAQLVSGQFDEVLGISATSVSSAFVSPYPPFAVEKVENNTVTYLTSSASSSQTITQNVQAPNRISALTIEGKNYWQDIYFHWTDSDGNSGTSHQDTNSGCANWLRGHSGYVGDPSLQAEINGNSTDFLWHYDIQTFISDALGDQYTPVSGNEFTISGGYFNASWTYESSSWYAPTASGTYMENVVFTYDGTSWSNSSVTSDNVVFGAVPNCTFTFDQSALAFAISCVKTNGEYGYSYSANANYPEFTVTFGEAVTTDTREWVFTDMEGVPIGTLPWGLPVSSLNGRHVLSSTSGYIEFRESIDSHAKGTSFSIPLMAVDVTSNSWSDYVYSGQRDYDIQQRKIASQQALVSGITSAITGSTSNAIMASIGRTSKTDKLTEYPDPTRSGWSIVKPGGSVGTTTLTSGMKVGTAAAASLGIGVGAALVDYASAQYFNGKLQKAEDTLSAKQLDSITTPGNGWDWVWHGRLPGLITLVPDDYSLTRFEDDIRLNGIVVSEPHEDCTAYIPDEGPIAITDLVVRGDIPVTARQYIKGRFANGVRLKTVNVNTTE